MPLCATLFVHCFIALSLIEVWGTECKNLSTMIWVGEIECFLLWNVFIFFVLGIPISPVLT